MKFPMNKGTNVFNRRDFIKLSFSIFAVVGLDLLPGCSPVRSERSVQVGVHLYRIHHELAEVFRRFSGTRLIHHRAMANNS